ncbi:MAG: hypothetical protein IPI23_19335 [Bacteroidetes bacterium]|nr:hypothetical protein [Bacteroidota bacterium]
MNTEIIFFLVIFILFIGLMVYAKLSNTPKINQVIGAFGFFLGCISTGMALAYGYRYISLSESYEWILVRIHKVNSFLYYHFDPAGNSIIRNGSIINRIKGLYHSLLDLVATRNELAGTLINPKDKYFYSKFFQHQNKEQRKSKNDNKQEEDKSFNYKQEEINAEVHINPWKYFVNKIKHVFQTQEDEFKQKDKYWENEKGFGAGN